MRHPVSIGIHVIPLLLLGAVAGPALADGAAKPAATLGDLSWMAGSWASDSAGVRIEEHWIAPAGGLMLGMHRHVVRGRATSFEFFRIAEEADGIAYLASPGGRPATRFALKSVGPRKVTFENPAHDFPQRIIYWLDDKGDLHARVEGAADGTEANQEWVWRPTGR